MFDEFVGLLIVMLIGVVVLLGDLVSVCEEVGVGGI